MGWMRSAKQMQKEEKEQREANRRPDRFWMKKSSNTDFVLVDAVEDAACVFEHQYKQDGSWKNWMTCPNAPDSPCCEYLGRKRRSAVYYVTIVDMTEWTDGGGKKHKYEVKLFPAKGGTFEKLQTKERERGSSLAGHVIKARRYSDQKSPGVGDEHEILREVDSQEGLWRVANFWGKTLPELWAEAEKDDAKMEALKKVFQLEFDAEGKLLKRVVPFNYEEILSPMEEDQVRRLLGRGLDNMDDSASSGSSGSSTSSGQSDMDEDDVPF
jgi:hypothetical protein